MSARSGKPLKRESIAEVDDSCIGGESDSIGERTDCLRAMAARTIQNEQLAYANDNGSIAFTAQAA